MLLACSKVPEGVLSEKKMQAVQTDMYLAEAMIHLNPTDYPDPAYKEALFYCQKTCKHSKLR